MRTCAATLLILLSAPAGADELDPIAGRALFNRQWIPAPSSTIASDGLGPLFNARSCVACHADGRGARVVSGLDSSRDIKGAVVRFGDVRGQTDPHYGQQLQTSSVPGLKSEGSARFLPHMTYNLDGPPLAPGINAGARLAPSLKGRANFEDISDEAILKIAAAQSASGGPLKGVARRLGKDGNGAVGRFGWKAAQATLDDQIANAFALDIGMSSPRDPRPYGDCTPLQTECLAMPNGESAQFDGREISGGMLSLVAAYLRSLSAPLPSMNAKGAALFAKTGCAACHLPSLEGKNGTPVLSFSDLLLHDMGPALDDGVGEPGVASAQWRTAPLLDMKYPGRRYLHDGRAATISEAVRAHGGEAREARKNYFELDGTSQRALNDYVKRR